MAKWKQLDFFEKINPQEGKDLVLNIEVVVPYEYYEGYDISINNLNHDYKENVLWWIENGFEVVGAKLRRKK